MNDVRYTIQLSAEDRDIILREAFPSAELEAKIRFGLRDGKFVTYTLDWDTALDLAECTAAAANHAKDRKLRRQLERLSDRIEGALQKQNADRAEPEGEFPRAMPAELRDEIRQLLNARPHASVDEIGAELAKINEAYNRRPRKETQGLSPEQVHRLLYTEWNAPDAGMKCRDDLTLEEANQSELFHNARIFLKAVQDADRVKATPSGNLNRKFIYAMVEAMRWPDGYIEEVWRFNKVLNEEDVHLLHELRIVLEAAGIIRKLQGHFVVTKKQAHLIDDAYAGRLYERLFSAFFARYNLAYADGLPEYPGVQQTLRYTLYVLAKTAQAWRKPEELARIAFLPAVEAEFLPGTYRDTAESVLELRVIRHLERFGLIACKRGKGQSTIIREIEGVRTTPLFKRFLHFEALG